jgi:hypothetical protein
MLQYDLVCFQGFADAACDSTRHERDKNRSVLVMADADDLYPANRREAVEMLETQLQIARMDARNASEAPFEFTITLPMSAWDHVLAAAKAGRGKGSGRGNAKSLTFGEETWRDAIMAIALKEKQRQMAQRKKATIAEAKAINEALDELQYFAGTELDFDTVKRLFEQVQADFNKR